MKKTGKAGKPYMVHRTFDEVLRGLSKRYDPRRVRDIMSAPQPTDRSETSRDEVVKHLSARLKEAMGGVDLEAHQAADGSLSFDFFFDTLDDEVLFKMSYL